MDEHSAPQEAEQAPEVGVETADILKSDSVQAVISRIREESRLAPPPQDEPQDAAQDEGFDESADKPAAEATDDPSPEPARSWVTPQYVAKAQAYGLDAADLEDFPSAAEFRRWASLYDRANARRVQSAPEPQDEPTAPAPPSADQKYVDGKINPAYFEARPDEYDEDYIATIRELRANQDFREQYQRDRAAADAERQQQLRLQVEWAVHDELDKQPDFFGSSVDAQGRPVNVPATEAERRGAVQATVNDLLAFYAGQGRPAPSISVLVRQAQQIALSEELAAQEQQAQAAQRQDKLERVADQSRRIRTTASSVGAKRAYANAPPADAGTTEAIFKSPDVQAVLRRIAEQNGF